MLSCHLSCCWEHGAIAGRSLWCSTPAAFGVQVVPKVQGAIPKREKKKKEPMGAHSWGWGDSMAEAKQLSSLAWNQAVHPKLAGPQGVPLATLPAC